MKFNLGFFNAPRTYSSLETFINTDTQWEMKTNKDDFSLKKNKKYSAMGITAILFHSKRKIMNTAQERSILNIL